MVKQNTFNVILTVFTSIIMFILTNLYYNLTTNTSIWMVLLSDTEALFSLHDLELEVYYAEDCKEHYRNITTTQTYERSTGDTHYVDDIVFCAGELGTGKGPCDVSSKPSCTCNTARKGWFCLFKEIKSRWDTFLRKQTRCLGTYLLAVPRHWKETNT